MHIEYRIDGEQANNATEYTRRPPAQGLSDHHTPHHTTPHPTPHTPPLIFCLSDLVITPVPYSMLNDEAQTPVSVKWRWVI